MALPLVDYWLPLADPSAQYYQHREPFRQLFQEWPWLAAFYTQAEAQFDVVPLYMAMVANAWVPLVAVALYLALCYFGPRAMEGHPPFDLRYPLAAWNGLLSLFSLCGTLRTVPHLVWLVTHREFRDTICRIPLGDWGSGATGLWMVLFILSKIPELGDTIFIVLRKKPLIFLHWYHHVTVLLFCWHSFVTGSPNGIYFASMNYTVHTVMYFYYGAMALRVPMDWFPTQLLTSMQILQMVLGVAILSCSFYYSSTDGPENPCRNDRTNQVVGALIYLSYLLLFVKFFIDRYILQKNGMSVPSMGSRRKAHKSPRLTPTDPPAPAHPTVGRQPPLQTGALQR